MSNGVSKERGIYKRGNIYWLNYTYRGKEVKETTGTSDLAEAIRIRDQRLAELDAERRGIAPFVTQKTQRLRVKDLLDRLVTDYEIRGRKSTETLRYHLKPLYQTFATMRALDLHQGRLYEYVKQRQRQGMAPATINRELAALRRAFNLAKQAGELGTVPVFPRLEENNVRQGFFEAKDVEALLRHLPDYLQPLVHFAWLTGWRLGEVTGLQWSMVDLPNRMIRLPKWTTKNGQGRVLVLTGMLWEVIRRQSINGSPTWVFHRNGARIYRFRKAWAKACKAAGLEGKLFHDLRRSAVRNLTRAGVPEKVAMGITGHKTRAVWDRYNIVNEDDLRDALQKVQRYISGAEEEQV